MRKKLFFLTLTILLVSIFETGAQTPFRDHRFSSYKTLPICNEGDILFVGNSITNMMNWWEAFGSRENIRGRGASGANSAELLYYFDDIVRGNPSKVFLMIGTNDLASNAEFNSPDSVAGRIIEFLSRTRRKAPEAEIYFQSILPTLNGNRTKEKTLKTNSIVENWIAEQNDPALMYIDLYTPLANDDGTFKKTAPAPDTEAISYDGLHITQEGYKIWLDIIKDYVGYEPVYGKDAINLSGGMPTSNGMRVSYWGALPVSSEDILLIGDELIHNGEFQERLKNTNIKDRGIGWGFPGITLENMEGAFDAILNGNTDRGVVKETPRAVTFYSGTGELEKGWNADSLFNAYSHAVNVLHEKLPETPIYAMTLLPYPRSQVEKNKVIAEFNNRVINELVNPAQNLFLIDLYNAAGGENRIEGYFMHPESTYVNGDGYIIVAETIGKALKGLETLSDFSLLPKPQRITFGKRDIEAKAVRVESPYAPERVADVLQNLKVDNDNLQALSVKCRIDKKIPYGDINSDEAYRLKITPEEVMIQAPTTKGLYWGLVTLNQLVMEDRDGMCILPECEITDWPAFSIRGFMNDTGRSFISLAELKEEIDAMSRFKMNVFHWHFTENQGYRLESKAYPQLNAPANQLRDKGKYYTLEEAKELVAYAAERNITVIPEIDMPGHSQYFNLTFGFDMQSPEGMKVLKTLIDEACEAFEDVPYFHIGTDEVNFTNPDFVPEMVAYVRNKGKKVVSWNPGWKYNPGEIDMVQMWSYRGSPLEGTPTIDSRFHYINHFDTYGDIVALYRSNVYGREKEDDTIKGLILALWNDRYIDDEKSIPIQNNLYPLLMATAEKGWDGGGGEYFDSLGVNMGRRNTTDFRNFEDFERRLLNHKATTLDDKIIPYVKQTNVNWLITDAFPNNGDMNAIFPPETEGPRIEYIYNDSVYKSKEATGAGIYLRHVWGNAIPAFYDNPQPDHTAYAFTNVYSPTDSEVGLQFETQNYSRSEPDLPPPSGQWDYRGSKLWINGEEIKPREWKNSHTEKDNEISLANENMVTDRPLKINLKKGWNTVMIKLPVGKFQTPEVRLVKWMFTFVFTTPDGRGAEPGLIYVPYIDIEK